MGVGGHWLDKLDWRSVDAFSPFPSHGGFLTLFSRDSFCSGEKHDHSVSLDFERPSEFLGWQYSLPLGSSQGQPLAV